MPSRNAFLGARLTANLKKNDLKIVLVESCTGGAASAALARIPGVSAHLCGSFVVYREASKIGWLDVPPAMLANDGAVGREVTELLALRALECTPEADLAAAITGHLGPFEKTGTGRSPAAKKDGLIFMSVAVRHSNNARHQPVVFSRQKKLSKPATKNPMTMRIKRQAQATEIFLDMVCSVLTTPAVKRKEN
ncbi:MAG: CinA family protein [Bacteriovoracia bacterium]